jgi:hypothetical protein
VHEICCSPRPASAVAAFIARFVQTHMTGEPEVVKRLGNSKLYWICCSSAGNIVDQSPKCKAPFGNCLNILLIQLPLKLQHNHCTGVVGSAFKQL